MREDTKSNLSAEPDGRKKQGVRTDLRSAWCRGYQLNPVTDMLFAIEGLSWMLWHEFLKLKHREMTTHVAFIRDNYILTFITYFIF